MKCTMSTAKNWDKGLTTAVAAAGGITRFARLVELSVNAVYAWKRVPAERVVEIEGLTNIPRERLRPDLYARRKIGR